MNLLTTGHFQIPLPFDLVNIKILKVSVKPLLQTIFAYSPKLTKIFNAVLTIKISIFNSFGKSISGKVVNDWIRA